MGVAVVVGLGLGNTLSFKNEKRASNMEALLGSGAGIRTQDLQVMSSNLKTGALDRQAKFPRVAFQISLPWNLPQLKFFRILL